MVGDWAGEPQTPEKGASTSAWRIHLDEHQMQCCRAAYYGTVNFIDDQVGRLLQYMQREGQLRQTIIVYTSDHGEMLGDHHLFRKCWPYEGSARVPYLIWASPSLGWAQELDIDAPVGWQDIMPTLLDAAGAESPVPCTGKSLMPLLKGETEAVRDVLHGEHAGQYDYQDGHHFLVSEHYKYVWYSQRDTEHLFDLAADPHEQIDLALRPEAETHLAPWRARLVEILKDRPEGFVDQEHLVVGQPHEQIIPGYEPDQFYPFL